MKPVNPLDYAAILTAAATAIRSADSEAVIAAAPLAPTSETAVNLAEPLYLQKLYESGASASFDVVMGKPYGFDTGPDDRQIDQDHLNFSRVILLREVMAYNNDSHKPIWAGNWGWNALPPDWTGNPSLWGQTTATQQAEWTLAGLERARQEWPWLGVMFLENWQPHAPSDDPHWGFSIAERETAQALATVLTESQLPCSVRGSQLSALACAYPGFHLATNSDPAQVYEGEWAFSPEFGADIGAEMGDRVTFTFWGTDVGLRVRRANFRARLYVTVDGQPANALPRDENGTMLILTAPDPNEDYVTTVPIAHDLEPGIHTVEIEAARGWDQWALNGFSVGYWPPDGWYAWAMALLALTAVVTLTLTITQARQADWSSSWPDRFASWRDRAQLGVTAVAGAIVILTGWLTWGEGMYRRLNDGGQLGMMVTTAVVFYVTPYFFIYIAALLVLFWLIYNRPAWGLVLITFTIPFYANNANALSLLTKPIAHYRFSPVEIFVWVTFAAFLLRQISQSAIRISEKRPLARIKFHPADYAVIAFTLVATLTLPFTERLGVATNEWRLVIIEPALFYFLLRAIKPSEKEMWLILDAFVLSGVVIALYGLWQYAFDRDMLITAEGGLMRLRSIFGSPNNVALYLGRIMPLLAAMFLLNLTQRRKEAKGQKKNISASSALSTVQSRWGLYSLALLPLGLAVLLSFSKGGLLLGVPAGLFYVFWRWQKGNGRSTWPYLIAFLIIGTIGLFVALQVPQLAGRLDLRGETGLFRINLWRSSMEMIREEPLTGVGLDNFLYAYRGRYIMDAAWQEPDLNHPHNLLLDFATRLGVFGLLTGLWMMGTLGSLLWRVEKRATAVWKPVAVGFGGAFVAMLAHGLVDHSFFLVDLAYLFYLMLATAVWLNKTSHQ